MNEQFADSRPHWTGEQLSFSSQREAISLWMFSTADELPPGQADIVLDLRVHTEKEAQSCRQVIPFINSCSQSFILLVRNEQPFSSVAILW